MADWPPLNDAILIAVAGLFADDPVNVRNPDARPRDPSHQTLTERFEKFGLQHVDVRRGKEKRVRAVLDWAVDHELDKGRQLVASLIAVLQGCGGFRDESPNFVGSDPLANAQAAFRSEGWILASDGSLSPAVLDSGLAGHNVAAVLMAYVRRARRGSEDDALVIGTGKDLLEATAAHVLVERYGAYDEKLAFPALLGMAFVAVGLAVPGDAATASEPARRKLERAMYDLGCGINRLRNKAGTGHGRPFIPAISSTDARLAVQAMGMVSELLLDALSNPRN